jgi:hypothetical protein
VLQRRGGPCRRRLQSHSHRDRAARRRTRRHHPGGKTTAQSDDTCIVHISACVQTSAPPSVIICHHQRAPRHQPGCCDTATALHGRTDGVPPLSCSKVGPACSAAGRMVCVAISRARAARALRFPWPLHARTHARTDMSCHGMAWHARSSTLASPSHRDAHSARTVRACVCGHCEPT